MRARLETSKVEDISFQFPNGFSRKRGYILARSRPS